MTIPFATPMTRSVLASANIPRMPFGGKWGKITLGEHGY